jgi:hypothetical protein
MNPDPARNRFSVLGYLAAFTLGMLCMTLVVIVIRQNPTASPPAIHYSAEQVPSESSSVDSPRQTFAERAHLTRISSPPPRPVPSRQNISPVSSPPRADAAEPIVYMESQPDQIPVPQPAAFILPTVAVVDSGQVDGISGQVFLKGQAPAEKPLPLDANCGKLHVKPPTTRFYVVNSQNGLGDVLVYVSEGLNSKKWPVPDRPHILNNSGCVFEPYISAARAGQKLLIQNLDAVLHNVHPTPTNPQNREFNFAQLPEGAPLELTMTAPEMNMRIKCDVHPWQFAYVSFFDHPYFAVTDRNGQFTLPPLPPGEYTIEASHRKSGTIQQKVRIKEGRPTELRFIFTVPAELQAQGRPLSPHGS